MVEILTNWYAQAVDFINWLVAYITTGVYDFTVEVFSVLTKVIIYSYIQGLIFSYDVASDVVQDLSSDWGLTQQISSAYSAVPSKTRQILGFFGIPEALTIIASAVPVRLAMKFIPFFGR